MNFLEKLENGFSEDVLENKVIEKMKTDNNYRYTHTYSPPCGHPPVITNTGKCAFCIVSDQLKAKMKQSFEDAKAVFEAAKMRYEAAEMDVFVLPKTRAQAVGSNFPYYVPDAPCEACGSRSGVFTVNSKCRACGGVPVVKKPVVQSARAQAIAAGEKWYTPSEPCSKCGTLSQRYVANGRCRGCKQ